MANNVINLDFAPDYSASHRAWGGLMHNPLAVEVRSPTILETAPVRHADPTIVLESHLPRSHRKMAKKVAHRSLWSELEMTEYKDRLQKLEKITRDQTWDDAQ